jgi:hypothetical protein
LCRDLDRFYICCVFYCLGVTKYFFVRMNFDELLDAARPVLIEATEQDLRGDNENAFKGYMKGIDVLMGILPGGI